MARYIRKLRKISSIGPTEERGFAIWAGYDLVGVDDDLSAFGLTNVEGWSRERLAEHGVTAFVTVEPDDEETWRKLGIERRR